MTSSKLSTSGKWQVRVSTIFVQRAGLNALLVAMERATYTTKSFVIAMALVLRRLTPEQAALAASVEVNSQIERWGEVEDSKSD